MKLKSFNFYKEYWLFGRVVTVRRVHTWMKSYDFFVSLWIFWRVVPFLISHNKKSFTLSSILYKLMGLFYFLMTKFWTFFFSIKFSILSEFYYCWLVCWHHGFMYYTPVGYIILLLEDIFHQPRVLEGTNFFKISYCIQWGQFYFWENILFIIFN